MSTIHTAFARAVGRLHVPDGLWDAWEHIGLSAVLADAIAENVTTDAVWAALARQGADRDGVIPNGGEEKDEYPPEETFAVLFCAKA
jgi:hypothetical protein